MNQFIEDKVKEYANRYGNAVWEKDEYLYYAQDFVRTALQDQVKQIREATVELQNTDTIHACNMYDKPKTCHCRFTAFNKLLALPILNPTPNDL